VFRLGKTGKYREWHGEGMKEGVPCRGGWRGGDGIIRIVMEHKLTDVVVEI
jgi:hypothetical protein